MYVLHERNHAHFWSGLLGPWVKGLRPKLLLPPIPEAWTKRTQSESAKQGEVRGHAQVLTHPIKHHQLIDGGQDKPFALTHGASVAGKN